MTETEQLLELRQFLELERRLAALCTRHECLVAGGCAHR